MESANAMNVHQDSLVIPIVTVRIYDYNHILGVQIKNYLKNTFLNKNQSSQNYFFQRVDVKRLGPEDCLVAKKMEYVGVEKILSVPSVISVPLKGK